MNRLNCLLPVLLAVLLGACAAGPTKMLLDPEVRSVDSRLGAGQSLQLQVIAQSIVSPLLDEQSRFALEQPAEVTVRNKLASGLARHGFQIQASADRQFVATVLKADHVISRGVLRDTITVETAIQFTAITSAGSQTRTFNDKRSREVGGRANLGEASGEMNQSLGHVLALGLNDADLIAFLGR